MVFRSKATLSENLNQRRQQKSRYLLVLVKGGGKRWGGDKEWKKWKKKETGKEKDIKGSKNLKGRKIYQSFKGGGGEIKI